MASRVTKEMTRKRSTTSSPTRTQTLQRTRRNDRFRRVSINWWPCHAVMTTVTMRIEVGTYVGREKSHLLRTSPGLTITIGEGITMKVTTTHGRRGPVEGRAVGIGKDTPPRRIPRPVEGTAGMNGRVPVGPSPVDGMSSSGKENHLLRIRPVQGIVGVAVGGWLIIRNQSKEAVLFSIHFLWSNYNIQLPVACKLPIIPLSLSLPNKDNYFPSLHCGISFHICHNS